MKKTKKTTRERDRSPDCEEEEGEDDDDDVHQVCDLKSFPLFCFCVEKMKSFAETVMFRTKQVEKLLFVSIGWNFVIHGPFRFGQSQNRKVSDVSAETKRNFDPC